MHYTLPVQIFLLIVCLLTHSKKNDLLYKAKSNDRLCWNKMPWEKAINSAEWQMTRVRYLLLAVLVMLSITHINLAGTQYVLQGNNINICKLNLEVLYMIYLNKMAVCFGKYYKHHFFPVSRILKLCSQTADLPLRSLLHPPPPET